MVGEFEATLAVSIVKERKDVLTVLLMVVVLRSYHRPDR